MMKRIAENADKKFEDRCKASCAREKCSQANKTRATWPKRSRVRRDIPMREGLETTLGSALFSQMGPSSEKAVRSRFAMVGMSTRFDEDGTEGVGKVSQA